MPEPSPPLTSLTVDGQGRLVAKRTVVDGCPVLPKLRCHEATMGQTARLIWTIVDPNGRAIDLSILASQDSQSESTSSPVEPFDAVADIPTKSIVLRMREITGMTPVEDPVFTIPVSLQDPAKGTVISAPLPPELMSFAGVYAEEWAVVDANKQIVLSNQCCCFVRRGLFGLTTTHEIVTGPPTIEEIRLSLRDNSGADNTLLQDVEFDAAEIAQAVTRSLGYWNESQPPLRPLMTTKTFPFRELWLRGIHAYLYEIAASNYRRNNLAYNAAGLAVDDKNKEQSYMAAATQLLADFRGQVNVKKLEINVALFGGTVSSPYAGIFF